MPTSTLRAALRGALFSLVLITPATAQGWKQKLTGSTTTEHDHFGQALIARDGQLFAGTPRDDVTGSQRGSGSVSAFHKSGSEWAETETIVSPTAAIDGGFGSSLSLGGDQLLVGAPGEDSMAAPATGAVHLFEEIAGAWTASASLECPTLAPGDRFGHALALDAGFLAVGVPGRDEGGWNTGCVVIFRETESGWTEDAWIYPPASSSGALFGYALALKGDTLVVGAPEHGDLALAGGAAFVFQRDAQGDWSAGELLARSESEPLQRFGAAVAVDEEVIVVGGPGSYAPFGGMGLQLSSSAEPPRGSAWVYRSHVDSWSLVQLLRAPAGQAGDLFGQHLSLSPLHLTVSSGGRGTAETEGGATFLFERSGSGWFMAYELTAPHLGSGEMFGAAATHRAGELFVSAIFDGSLGERAGSVEVYELNAAQHQHCFGEECPCGNTDPLAGCANSTGAGALLYAHGSPSFSEDDLVVGLEGAPAGTPVLVFFSSGSSQAFFGDGLLCLGGSGVSGLGRLARAKRASQVGAASWGPGLFENPGVMALSGSLYLQAVYRDPESFCGTGLNLSSALSIQPLP